MPNRTSTVVERIREIADQFERDRREPDKVLCAVQNLRRLATDIEAAPAYPQWKIDAFRNRNAGRCSCPQHIPGVEAERWSETCPVHDPEIKARKAAK